MGRLLVLFAVIDIAVLVVALIDCLSVPAEQIRALPRVVWALIIVFFTPIGGILWFVAGRPVAEPDTPGGGTPTVPSGGRGSTARAPDDDPEFLRTLGASAEFTREDADLMQQWEADLRRRERDLRRDRDKRRADPAAQEEPDSPTD